MARGYSYNSYSNFSASDLKNIQLPDKIRCDRCNRWKNPTNFANKRLNDLRYKIKYQGRNKTNSQGGLTATCSACTGQQVQELECHMCKTWKGLEDFAKAQRKNPDHAKCNECMREQLDTQPVEDDNQVDTNSSSSGDEDDDDNWNDNTSSFSDEYTSLKPKSYATSTDGTSNTGILVPDLDGLSSSANESSTGEFYTPINQNTPAASEASGRANTPSSAWGASSSSTGFNPFQYGHPRGKSSAASVADSTRTTGTVTTGSRWAKVKAYKPEPKGKQAAMEEDAWDVTHDSDTDSDDDDEDDDDEDHKGFCL
ncbi:uncharacterized protein K452DRAFT_298758 [Aplosporella prunicola CBS 121167]|uniref:Stc1 domain-containing protein n=1 Tax=Aplosporella prunicola CBS 121167 TaxID=1176127 RepID=A0A6A6BCP5_9PEZI|nr:uncharacterized protein K452DRAFT_298758 [Aplosporella prunicola CBS 121167]KAF2141378.1 hypothetical protein K452DRAFT_298758 [Aplosporella prunicola CBS 121167]